MSRRSRILPAGLLRNAALYLVNDFFRSFGNMFWCCNPLSGLCFFLAVLVFEPFQACALTIHAANRAAQPSRAASHGHAARAR